MHKRWPLVDAKDESSARDKINDRYFVKRMGHKGYFRHGISRLWWTAHLTHLEGEPDIEKCYALTRFAFSRQEYQFGIFLRKFGASRHVACAILGFFRTNEQRILAAVEETPESDKSFNHFIKYANKQMNIYGSVYVLDVLERDQIHKLMERSAAAFYGSYWD